MSKRKRRRLFFDIETSPNIGFFWQPGWKVRLTHENIIHERAIITICWKWAGDSTVGSLQWNRKQSDKRMLERFLPIMNQADEVVGHNGDRFDLPWLRSRCLYHGIDMVPNYVSIDTLKLARGRFKFNSNRLDYIAKFLSVGAKHRTDYTLWKRIVLDNDPVAMRRMIRYCQQDVRILEKVWNKMQAYVPPRSSVAEYASQCPECGSDDTIINKRRRTASGYNKVVFQCKACGCYHTIAASRFDRDVPFKQAKQKR